MSAEVEKADPMRLRGGELVKRAALAQGSAFEGDERGLSCQIRNLKFEREKRTPSARRPYRRLPKLEKATEGLEDQGPLSVLGIAVNSLF